MSIAIPSKPSYAPEGASVYLGLSGGVDSCLSAALLQRWGYEVHPIYMRNWSRDLPGFKCTWAEDLADAERICVKLGLDLEVWDCEREYKETVVDYLVDAYARGLTPNPDVMCNQTVKFGTFAERAFAEGADFIATGHYAQVDPLCVGDTHAQDTHKNVSPLLRAADEHKDQTYFLWRVARSMLEKTIFPIGDIPSKKEVRSLCATFGLGVEQKPDSDGICFVGEVGIRTFLLDLLDRRAGDVVEWETNKKLGEHDGAFLFTLGQRRGLNLGGGPARYVVATDTTTNTVYVSADKNCPRLWCDDMNLIDVHVLGEAPLEGSYTVRLRHTGRLIPCEATRTQEGIHLSFSEKIPAIAAGQSAVLYDGRRCVAGGIIAHSPVSLVCKD